jgi:hypothetical protein
MFLKQFLGASLALALLQGGSAWAATYWVSSNGSDGNSCASVSGERDPSRYRTVTGGLSCISPGDTLKIKNGTYNYIFPKNPIPSGSSPSAKTCIVGESRDAVVFRPTATTQGVIDFGSGRTNICIRNLTINGDLQPDPGVHTGIAQGGSGGHYNWEITDVTIKNMGINNDRGGNGIILEHNGGGHYIARVRLENNGANRVGNGIYWRTKNSIIEHSLIINNSNDGLHMWNPKADNVDNNIVRYNIIVGNGDRGINMASGFNNLFQDNIIRSSLRNRFRRSGNKIYNNTFYGMTSSCIILEDGPLDVRKNIALNCGRTAIRNDSADSTILNNLTSANATDVFVNPQTGDFTLKADIGAGATINTTNATPTTLNTPVTPGNLQAVAK